MPRTASCRSTSRVKTMDTLRTHIRQQRQWCLYVSASWRRTATRPGWIMFQKKRPGWIIHGPKVQTVVAFNGTCKWRQASHWWPQHCIVCMHVFSVGTWESDRACARGRAHADFFIGNFLSILGPIKFDISQNFFFFPVSTQTIQNQPRDGPTLIMIYSYFDLWTSDV
jgi:hypothetical protein